MKYVVTMHNGQCLRQNCKCEFWRNEIFALISASSYVGKPKKEIKGVEWLQAKASSNPYFSKTLGLGPNALPIESRDCPYILNKASGVCKIFLAPAQCGSMYNSDQNTLIISNLFLQMINIF